MPAPQHRRRSGGEYGGWGARVQRFSSAAARHGSARLTGGEGAGKAVLVPEAHALGMLAALRSLGRAGYRVHAASPRADAIGFASRHCALRALCPPYDGAAYLDWLRGYLAEHNIGLIVPGGAFLLAVESCFEEFQPRLPLAPERAVVYRALSKTEVYEAFQAAPAALKLLDNHPASLVLARGASLPAERELAALGAALYLKADARHGAAGADDLLLGPLDAVAARDAAGEALTRYRKVLLQRCVSGRQAGVTLLMDADGRVLAENSFLDVHDQPTRRGTMSLRRTWRHPDLVADAVRRLRHLRWQGAAMLEYRVRDGEGDGGFDFIELNPRFWQSLHLDLLAGVDFPRLQMAWFQGMPLPSAAPAREVICGDLWPGEISRMIEIWRSPRFGGSARLRETAAFLARLADWRVASDYAFPGDRAVYWHRVGQVLGGWLGGWPGRRG